MIYFHLHQNIALACKDLKNDHEYRYRPHDVTARRSSHSTQVPPYGDKRLDFSTVTTYGVSAGAAYTNDQSENIVLHRLHICDNATRGEP